MSSSSLSAYLASKYLTATPSASASSTTKKRKRKDKDKSTTSASSGLIISNDDDAASWSTSKINNGDEDADNDGPTLLGGSGSAEFRKSKKSSWKSIGSAAPTNADLAIRQGEEEEASEADAIIRSAEAENRARETMDEEPVVEDDAHERGGLRTAAQVSASIAAARAAERADWEAEEAEMKRRRREERRKKKQKGGGGGGEEEEEEHEESSGVVYRDATGRRIDISMARAAARNAEEEKLEKEKRMKEDLLGEVRLKERERRREEVEDARFLGVARGVDDEEMNRELKGRVRWGDTMAGMIEASRAGREAAAGGAGAGVGGRGGDGGGGGGGGEGRGPARKLVYNGAAAPNRYGIRPGYRWDGVDRGNGWEGERFKELNRGRRNKELDYAWQMDE